MNKIYSIILIFFFSITSAIALERDSFVEETLVGKDLVKPKANINYNYEALNRIPIKLNITEEISTKNENIYDGQELKFKVKEDVFFNNKLLIKQGTIATAKLETIIERGMNGLPATLIIDNFKIKNIPQEKLKCTIIHKGHNRAYYVFPIKWVLTPTIIGGYLANFLIGGHAILKQKKARFKRYCPQ